MPDFADPPASVTTSALLSALLVHEESGAWSAFDARYRPIVIGSLRRMGLPSGDAEDLAQEVMVEFISSHREGKFDRSRRKLGAWLLTVARTKAIDHLRRRRPEIMRDSVLANTPEDIDLEVIWREEERRHLIAKAFAQLRAHSRLKAGTLEAFEMHVLKGLPAEAVARELGVRVGAVHLAKHRCMDRLREHVRALEAAFEVEAS